MLITSYCRRSFWQFDNVFRRYLKIRILVPDQGGRKVQTGGIHWYCEDLKRAPNTDMGTKDFFELLKFGLCSSATDGFEKSFVQSDQFRVGFFGQP